MMKKSYFLLYLILISGLFVSQKSFGQCPILDPTVGTGDFGPGVEVCYQPGGSSADITFTFLNNGADFDNFLLYDITNSSFLIEGLSPVVYVHAPGSNIWIVQNVPDEFVATKNSLYILAKAGCPTFGGTGIDLVPANELRIDNADISVVDNTRCIAPFNGSISINVTGGYGAYTYDWTGPNGFSASTQNIAALEPGTYSISVTDDHNCTYTRNIDVVDNSVNPVVSFTGLNPAYCENEAVAVLIGSVAPNGSFSGPGITDNGNGTASFDPAAAGIGGDITYTYTDALGCTGVSIVPVVVNPIPATPTASANGPLCEGETLNLSTDPVAGATYNWTGPNGFTSTDQNPTLTNVTVAADGNYQVTITVSGCESPAGSISVTVEAAPTIFDVTGGGTYCESAPIAQSLGLAGSEAGVNYILVLNGTTDIETIAGNGAGLAFTAQTIPGSYTVRAESGISSCVSDMNGNAIIIEDATPNQFNVTGGGSYCIGSPSGIAVGLDGSENGIIYFLVRDGATDVETVVGDGNPINFTPQILGGTYTVRAERSTSTCTEIMLGNALITENPLPTIFDVSGGGSYCAGSPVAQLISLSGSEVGVNYILVLDGTTDIETVAGTGAAINFTDQTAAGTYTVRAENGATACTENMNASAVISIDPLPAIFDVTGGGNYCIGTPVAQGIGLSGSESGVNYILVLDGATDIETVAGTGAAIAFNPQITPGTYTVRAENATTSCIENMNGSAVVSADPLPVVFNVTGGGSYCAGVPTPIAIGLDGSESGVNYVLVLDGATDIETVAGTGSAIGFADQTVAGTYTVRAEGISVCTLTMTGSADIITDPIPAPILAGTPAPQCQETGVVYTVTNPQPGSIFAWSVPLGTVIVADNGASITVDFGVNSGDISVVETNGGCSSLPAAFPVSLQNCSYTADFTFNPDPACIGSQVLFTNTSTNLAGTTFDWDFGPNGTPSNSTDENPLVTFNASGIIDITLIITNGAQTDQVTKQISVNELPTADLSGTTTICPGGSAVLTFAFTGIGPWDFEYTDGSTNFVGTANSSPYTINVSPVTTTTYDLLTVNDVNCNGTVSGSAIIDVTPAKNVTIQLDNISGTPGSTVAVPVRVVDFVDLMTMQFTITWDPALLTYSSVSSINLGNVTGSSFGTSEVNNGILTFSWNTASLSDTSIVDNTSLFSVDFTIPNTVCPDAPVTIDESAGASTPIEVADENLCLANVTVVGGNVQIQSTASITSDDADNLICFGNQVIFTGLPGGLTNYDFYLNGAIVQSGGNNVYVNNSLTDQDSVNVVVGDPQGCTLAAQGIITTVNQLTVTPTITDITTCGASDGEIALVVGGGAGLYTFNWTGPDIIDPALQDQANLGRGFYAVVVTDNASGCSETVNIELKEPVDFTISATKTDVSTTGGNDGSINLTVTGGSGTFNFNWTGPNGFTSSDQNISSLFAGIYIATVSDNGGAGCTDAITVDITQPMNALILSATKTDVTACGAMDGTVNLIITGGSGSFAISWIGPNSYTSNSQNIAGLEGGLYIATVVDLVTSLSAQWSVQVDEPNGFAINADPKDITYCSGADGSVSLTVMGGSGDFGYAWTDLSGLGFSSTNKDISDLELGTYRVVVTDNVSGCVDSTDAVVGRPAICDQPCGLYVESTTNNTSCPDTEDGVAVINIISGGSGPGNYYVSVDTGKTFVPFLGQDITAIIDQGQGSYLYIVKDTVTSCTDTTIANVGVSTNLMANISVSDAGCSEDDGTITFNVSGGVVPFEVDIIDSLGNVTSKQGNGFFQFMDLTPGSYFYTVREQSGCTIVASDSIELGVDCQTGCSSLIASARNFEDATCGSDPNGKAIIDVTGGASPYEYSVDGTNWIPFISGNVIDKLPPNGTYNIAIRQDADNADCRTTVSVTIDGPEVIVLQTPIITTQKATCNQNDGAVKIGRVVGGTGSFNYQIDGAFFNMPSDSILADLGAGIHTFSVIDAVACQADFVFQVESPGVIVATATDVPVSCTSIFLKAGIRIEVDLDSTTLPGPYEAYVARTSDPNNGIIYQIPDNGIRTILNLDKDFYTINISSGVDGGCTYSETISVFSGASPVDFEIIDSDSIVSCIGDYGSITIGNVIGDQDTTFIVQLISETNQILETYQVNWFEFEGGFTIDETNSDKLVAGKYYIKLIQNQNECVGVTAISDLITIYEPLGQLSFEILEDEVSLADRPTGYIIGEVIPSGGNPYEARIQLIEPVFELNVTDIIEFNEKRKWEEVPSTGDNLNRFPHRFDSLWAGTYEISVRDDYGCEYYLEYSIGYDETVFIPNVFTPNDDGYNDTFYIRNLPESGTKVVITNRNGFVVFRSDDYNIDTLWDGGDVSDGIYYYSINMPGGETFKGWVEKWSGSRP